MSMGASVYSRYSPSTMISRHELYRIICNSRQDISLEMVMQSGRDQPDLEAFLPLWIEYLGSMNTKNAEGMLREAMELFGDGQQLLAGARKYSGVHPELYEQYPMGMQGKADAASLLEVGAEAVEFIGKKYLVRSRIALLTSRFALELDRRDEAERYWMEAFRSDTRVVHYLRLVGFLTNPEVREWDLLSASMNRGLDDEKSMKAAVMRQYAETGKHNPEQISAIGSCSFLVYCVNLRYHFKTVLSAMLCKAPPAGGAGQREGHNRMH